jgi:formamidopyrimidine-DNA glycosylase
MLKTHIFGEKIHKINVYNKKLRWPVPDLSILLDKDVQDVYRRGKYIVICFDDISLLVHLGMTGSIWNVKSTDVLKKHDHVEFFIGNKVLRYNDPRRFGSILLADKNPKNHKLITKLGVEPLTSDFDVKYLYSKTQKSTRSIKNLIMDSHVVVGVGNIYAAESLFKSMINPMEHSKNVSKEKIGKLVEFIKEILQQSILAGGTTLKDYYNVEGTPGYFKQQLRVYGRKGEDCYVCKSLIEQVTIGQRSSAFCPNCQPLNL